MNSNKSESSSPPALTMTSKKSESSPPPPLTMGEALRALSTSPGQPQSPWSLATRSRSPRRNVTNISAAELTPALVMEIFGCCLCYRALQDPIALPCGASICKRCLPPSGPRTHVTWPLNPERRNGFRCPLVNCRKPHAEVDCVLASDIAVRDLLEQIGTTIERTASTSSSVADKLVGLAYSRFTKGIPLGAVTLAFDLVQSDSSAADGGCNTSVSSDEEVVELLREHKACRAGKPALEIAPAIRGAHISEPGCPICYQVFYDPISTVCGHTFCRGCLTESFETSVACPLCRQELWPSSYISRASRPPNTQLLGIIEAFWPQELRDRHTAKLSATDMDRGKPGTIPILPGPVVFPGETTTIRLSGEENYAMLRCSMKEYEGVFGVAGHLDSTSPDDDPIRLVGTRVVVVGIQKVDERLYDVVVRGLSRFCAVSYCRHWESGFILATVEPYADVGVAEDEARESMDTRYAPYIIERSRKPGVPPSPLPDLLAEYTKASPGGLPVVRDWVHSHYTGRLIPIPDEELEVLPTEMLIRLAVLLLLILRITTGREADIASPFEPDEFAWWFAAKAQVSEDDKYGMLLCDGTRDRMILCCKWLMHFESYELAA